MAKKEERNKERKTSYISQKYTEHKIEQQKPTKIKIEFK